MVVIVIQCLLYNLLIMTTTPEKTVIIEETYQTQKECFGVGARRELTNILEALSPSSVFLVAGKRSFDKLDKRHRLTKLLGDTKITRFSDFEPNPKLEDIEKGMVIFKRQNPDVVVALGGGGVIDTAKAINSLASQDDNPAEFVKGERKIKKKGKPFIAIPTTSGTGSESTHFAVIYIDGVKYSLADPSLLPDYAIIDPELTFDLPKEITATTGLDGLCQAIESYWSNKSTTESKQYAMQALKLLFFNLESAVNNPTAENRIAVSLGSHLSGKAINISFTTASHAISYPITSYFNVPHGKAVALTIAAMLEFNSEVTEEDVQDARGVNYVKKTVDELCQFLGAKTAQEAAGKIKQLLAKIGAPTKLSQVGIRTSEDIAYIVAHGFNPARVKNNPRQLSQPALLEMLHQLR